MPTKISKGEDFYRSCDYCGKRYKVDKSNYDRGWDRACSKSHAAKLREQSKPGYDKDYVKFNNVRRATWKTGGKDMIYNKDE